MTSPTKSLLAIAVEHTDLSQDEIMAIVGTQLWLGGVGWPEFVPWCIRDAWAGMSPDARLAVLAMSAVAHTDADG